MGGDHGDADIEDGEGSGGGGERAENTSEISVDARFWFFANLDREFYRSRRGNTRRGEKPKLTSSCPFAIPPTSGPRSLPTKTQAAHWQPPLQSLP